MKVAGRLAILVAALLLVTNMAFAQCTPDQLICYEILLTYEIGDPDSDLWEVCLNYGHGTLHSLEHGYTDDLYLFGGGPGWFNTSGSPAIGGNPGWTTWIVSGEDVSGFIQPIGDGYMLTGAGQLEGNRSTLQGKKVPCILDDHIIIR
jgi:hypothetical protein